MSLKLKVRNISRPLCQGLENALELAGKREAAQRFRQIQHERLGLSSSEWESLRSYFIYDELIWISRQRGKSLWYMMEDMVSASEEPPDGRPPDGYEFLNASFMKNKEERQRAINAFESARERIKKSPLYRAMKSQQQCRNWHMSDWLVSRCKESGGCCARECRCCDKNSYEAEDWMGHCTPACGCCQKEKGLQFPIDLEGFLEELYFNVDPAESDVFSRRMMDAYVWGLLKKNEIAL